MGKKCYNLLVKMHRINHECYSFGIFEAKKTYTLGDFFKYIPTVFVIMLVFLPVYLGTIIINSLKKLGNITIAKSD
jgi:hypothetical protein